LKQSVGEPLSILRFWRDLEIFNIPTAPSSKDATDQVKIVTLRDGALLPWENPEFKPTDRDGYVHVVHVGVAEVEDLARLLLQALFPKHDLTVRERERTGGKGWMAAFVVTETGHVKLDSYLASSFVHGVDALLHERLLDNINVCLKRARDEFAQRRHALTDDSESVESAVNASPKLTWKDLSEELNILRELLGDPPAADIEWRVVVRVSRVKRQYLDGHIEAAANYLNSFYLDDLDRLIGQAQKSLPFGKALSAYLGAPLPETQRTDILECHDAMADLVSVARLPSARWPSPAKHPLVLAQQAAVSHVLHALGPSAGVIGINGPPGTGKTTLLCDVIAEVVTKRARQLLLLNKPADLFGGKLVVAGKNFFPLKPGIVSGTSIVIASNNNNAVKNITQELPARKKVSDEYGPSSYFEEVILGVFTAQKVLGDDDQPLEAWGLVAAALGNAGNRRAFSHAFYRIEYDKKLVSTPGNEVEEDSAPEGSVELEAAINDSSPSAEETLPPSMRQVLEQANKEYARYQNEWPIAKKKLQALLDDFGKQQTVLMQAERAAQRIDESRERVEQFAARVQGAMEEFEAAKRALASDHVALTVQRLLVESRQSSLAQRRTARLPNLWDRLVSWFGRETRRMAELRAELEEPTQAFAQAAELLAEWARSVARQEEKLKALQNTLQTLLTQQHTLTKECLNHESALQAGYDLGARHFPDERLWSLPFEERHRASAAVSPALDTLRARIFLHAIELHRLTILANAGRFISNLGAVAGMLTGKSRDNLSIEHRPLLWDAFFFVVPVVSTTLASFDRLFLGMGQESLGWLLIDEAGQATPQSAAGAIWRSRRAVLIGDPLQIEPIFTVPLALVEDLHERHRVASIWSPKDESVQTLADRVTQFGSWVAQDQDDANGSQRIWIGMPLRTHRRCDEPMFGVANQVAYAGQMVQGRVDSKGKPEPVEFSCVLGASAWFDVKSTQTQHPVVDEELDVLMNCLHRLKQQPAFVIQGKQDEVPKPAKIYVITPFRKVKTACASRVKKAGLKGVECGTVHTFQGKEADIVFFVLGTASGQLGAGARAWASSKPNLLNVAITRAKCRLYVIGDAENWGRLEHFKKLRLIMPIQSI
jgi:hypothetical protein